jgi:hypothetical protein
MKIRRHAFDAAVLIALAVLAVLFALASGAFAQGFTPLEPVPAPQSPPTAIPDAPPDASIIDWDHPQTTDMQINCWPGANGALIANLRDNRDHRFKQVYGERLHIAGLTPTGKLVQITSNPVTGTWTIVMTDAAGVACLVGGGTRFTVNAMRDEPPLAAEAH